MEYNTEFENLERKRYYGLRIGDLVLDSWLDDRSPIYEVVGFSITDNNRVYIKNIKTNEVDNTVAEWCKIIKKVDEDSKPLEFRALASIRKDKKLTDKLDWYEGVFYNGNTVVCDTHHQGLQYLQEVRVVSEYTGYKDLKGNKIWDSSLLYCNKVFYKVIKYKGKAFELIPLNADIDTRFLYTSHNKVEVVGDLYTSLDILNDGLLKKL